MSIKNRIKFKKPIVEEKKEEVDKKTEQSKKANQAFKELFGE